VNRVAFPLLVLVGLVVSGCAHSHGSPRAADIVVKSKPMSADQAFRSVRRTQTWWRHQIRSRADAYPRARFDNLTTAQLRRRLADLASRYHFVVKSVELWQPLPRQFAPTVVVRASDLQAFASATSTIMRRLDPKQQTSDDRTGWRYEGFFLNADDDQGVPFIAVFNFWRGVYSRGGGQWARSEDLLPFATGGRPVVRH
jgi:hypothetical protein